MNDKEIIDNLIKAQNDTPDYSQRNQFTKEEYNLLLNDVKEVLKENKDLSLSELRYKLYEKANLEEKLEKFFLTNKKAPGAVISFGTYNLTHKIVIGNKEEINNGKTSIKEMEEDTIFDLASITKLFTSISILQLAGIGELKISDNIKSYLPNFKNLGNHTIYDLLTFQPYHTEKRIDSAKSIEEAEEILFKATPYNNNELVLKDRYNDIAPMILKYIVEKVSNKSFEEYVKENILRKANMSNTFVNIPDDLKEKVANFNYNYEIDKSGNILIRDKIEKGISSDSKAVALGQPLGHLPGHAGLFSTCDDLVSLSKGLINCDVLHVELTKEMAKNRTSNLFASYNGIIYPQCYGFLVYSKSPYKKYSEVYAPLSGSTLSTQGWTGTSITIDPINKINLVYLSNRIHNRIISNNSNKAYNLIDATKYNYERKEITNACLRLALEEKMLEDIIGNDIEKETIITKIKKTH